MLIQTAPVSYTCECPHPTLRITEPDFMLLRASVIILT